MDARQLKAQVIVGTGKITRGADCYFVPSQSGAERHRVTLEGLFPGCTCPDFELTGQPCKHMLAVRGWLGEQITGCPADKLPPDTRLPRKNYPRDWPTYNTIQTREKDLFLALLADLCRTVPEPSRKNLRGRPIPLADGIFSACYKVYSGFSARRFTCDLEEARERGHISGRAPHFNSVLNVLDNDAVMPILSELVRKSASPLRQVETQFAVDSSGFSGSRFVKWYDRKYGHVKEEADWVKAHICCGTRTNIIAVAEVLDKNSGDSPQFPGLVQETAKGFRVHEVAADKAYAGVANFDAVDALGGTLYAAFKINATGAVGGVYAKMFHLFGLHREEYLQHYHRRSLIETTFSMVKTKFGDFVRAKTERAMKNEVLAKFLCHNLCCIIAAVYELGIDPAFVAPTPCTTEKTSAQIIQFPGRL